MENRNERIVFSTDSNHKITLHSGPLGQDALKMLNIYTGSAKTAVSVTGTEGIDNAIADMQDIMDRVLSIRSDIGARMNRTDLTYNRLDSDEINFTRLMSDNEDADMAQVIMNLKNEENVYNASLAGGARIIQPTLADFLK